MPVPLATTAPNTSPAATWRGPNRHQYRRRQPVSLGPPILTADLATITDPLRPVSPGVFEYDVYHSPWNRKPTRRIDIFRLPRDATLVEKAPSDTKVENFEGQIQMCFDRLLEPGDAYRARFRYAMPPPTTQQ